VKASPTALARRLSEIRGRIAAAAERSGRSEGAVTLIGVAKTVASALVAEAIEAGLADVGESRVQEALLTIDSVGRRAARWHMIGHLQRNKVKAVLPLASVIHSIDSLRLAEEIDAQAAKLGRKMPVLMQVNAGEEPQKFGVAVGAAVHLAEQVDSMPNLQLVGLMTMAPLEAPEQKVRQAFSRTREIFEELKWHKIGGTALRHLSMGMSNDFELAIAEGATLVRVGSLLFGGKIQDHEMMDDEG